MTPLFSDPGDYEVLTLGHFLVGRSLTQLPEPDQSTTPLNRLKRYALIESQLQIFWQRWAAKYLPKMQRHGRWTAPSRNASVGDLEILRMIRYLLLIEN